MRQGMAAQLDAGTCDLLRQELRAELRGEIKQEIIEAEVKVHVQAEVIKCVRAFIKELEMQRRRQFGRSTETSSAQYRLFDEADALAENSSDEDDQAELPEENARTTPRKPAKPRGKRQPLPADLPRVEIVYAMSEDERICPCGCTPADPGALGDIETAKANRREPYAWLRHALLRLPYAKTADHFQALLPWNLSALALV